MWSRFVTMLCVTLLGMTPFSIARAPYTFSFPRDHFAHTSYRTEWWYFTGHLHATNGRRFGYELTFFRIGLEPTPSRWTTGESKWRAYQLYPAHFAITDIDGQHFTYSTTLARDALGQGAASSRKLEVVANGWSLTGTPELRPRMRLRASSGANVVSLVMRSAKPPAIHGHGGVSLKGSCASCASHYYSFTRLMTGGTLELNGQTYSVTGTSWMDHEFGSDELQARQSGWDWFAIQLNDGREIMLYRLRETDGTTTPQSSGSLIASDGSVTFLPLRAFTIASLETWKSPRTGAAYPSGWRVSVATIGKTFELQPFLPDQELIDQMSTTYWEGAADVRDPNSGKSVGQAYVELTGYTSAVRF